MKILTRASGEWGSEYRDYSRVLHSYGVRICCIGMYIGIRPQGVAALGSL